MSVVDFPSAVIAAPPSDVEPPSPRDDTPTTMLFEAGDRVFASMTVVCDAGTLVQVLAEGPGLRKTLWLPRGILVKVEPQK